MGKSECFIDKIIKEDYEYFLNRRETSNVILSEITSFTNIDADANIKVLDVGSNFCFIPYHLSRNVKWDIHCLDLTVSKLLKYPEISFSFKLTVADATKIPFKDETFDLIICNHVIEHIWNYEECVNEIIRVTKTEGYIYIAMPNLNRIIYGRPMKNTLLWYIRRISKMSTKNRVKYHAGFSHNEIKRIFSSKHKILCQNKEHGLIVLKSKKIKYILKVIPKIFFNNFSPSNVFIIKRR